MGVKGWSPVVLRSGGIGKALALPPPKTDTSLITVGCAGKKGEEKRRLRGQGTGLGEGIQGRPVSGPRCQRPEETDKLFSGKRTTKMVMIPRASKKCFSRGLKKWRGAREMLLCGVDRPALSAPNEKKLLRRGRAFSSPHGCNPECPRQFWASPDLAAKRRRWGEKRRKNSDSFRSHSQILYHALRIHV